MVGEQASPSSGKMSKLKHKFSETRRAAKNADPAKDGTIRSRSRSPRGSSRSPRKERARRKRKKERDRRKVLLAYGSPEQKAAGGVGVGAGKKPLLSPKAPSEARASIIENGASPRVGVASIKSKVGDAKVTVKDNNAKKLADERKGYEACVKETKANEKMLLDFPSEMEINITQVASPGQSRATSPENVIEEKKAIGVPIRIGNASPATPSRRQKPLTKEDVEERVCGGIPSLLSFPFLSLPVISREECKLTT